jgi:ACT domain
MKHRTPRRGQKEYQMSVFTVNLKNQPGELARLCEAMADRGINLVPSATARREQGTVVFIADDEASAETVLQEADIGYTMRPARMGHTAVGDNRPSARASGTTGPGQPPGRLADM